MSEQEVLQSIYTQLSKVFKVEKMILFGSRAKGTATVDSDYDVFVVAESDIPFGQRQGAARIALGPRNFPLDLLVYTPDEAREGRGLFGSIVYIAELEGKVFYAEA